MPSTTPFTLFGPAHLATIGLLASLTTLLSLVLRTVRGRSWEPRVRAAVCGGLALLLASAAVLREATSALEGRWTLRDSLPLHLCDLGLLTTLAALLASGRRGEPGAAGQVAFELSYYWGLAGTTQAVLTPTLGADFPSREFILFFATHGGIVISVLVMTVGAGLRPRPGSVTRTWIITALLVPPVALVNWLTGGNYMYLCGPPASPSLYDYLGPWPWSLASMGILGWVFFSLLYAPFGLRRRIPAPDGSAPRTRGP